MTVKQLKELLQEKLDILEEYDDDLEVKMVGNTYFLGGAREFLGIAGYNGGYINLEWLEEQIVTNSDEDDEEE